MCLTIGPILLSSVVAAWGGGGDEDISLRNWDALIGIIAHFLIYSSLLPRFRRSKKKIREIVCVHKKSRPFFEQSYSNYVYIQYK